jgi:NTE family protein
MAKKIGLVLGSGAARGLSHIGVLKVLDENGIKPDFVAGCSIGSLIGAVYCAEGSYKSAEELAMKLDKKHANALFDWNVPKQGLVAGERIRKFLKTAMVKEFSELKIPLAVVTTDLCDGREKIIEQGNLLDAVMASIAIPVLFKPVRDKDEVLVDGGVLDPLPVEVAEAKGCDVIIAVDVEYKTCARQEIKPTIFNIAVQSLLLTRERHTELLKKSFAERKNVIIITPELKFASYLDFSQAKTLIPLGEEAARAAIPKIQELLKD